MRSATQAIRFTDTRQAAISEISRVDVAARAAFGKAGGNACTMDETEKSALCAAIPGKCFLRTCPEKALPKEILCEKHLMMYAPPCLICGGRLQTEASFARHVCGRCWDRFCRHKLTAYATIRKHRREHGGSLETP
jgi:hypothetical protein